MPSLTWQQLEALATAIRKRAVGCQELVGLRLEEEGMSGSWYWSRRNSDVALYATPWWEDSDSLVVQLSDGSDDEVVDLGTLRFTGNTETDAQAYLKLLCGFLRAARMTVQLMGDA